MHSMPGTRSKSAATSAQGRPRHKDWAAFSLILFAGLNLNGVLLLLTNKQSLLSPLILLSVLILLLRYMRMSEVGEAFILFILFYATYLVSSSLIALGGVDFDTYYLHFYLSTLLFILGVYFWVAGCSDWEVDSILKSLKSILLVSCFFVPLSPLLADYLPYTRPEDRASGLFDNPGEASSAALYCMVLIAAYPSSRFLITLGQVSVALLALAMTFSKTGMIALVILLGLLTIKRRSLALLCLVVAGIAVSMFALDYALSNNLLQLSVDQRERLSDVTNVLSGEIDRKTTTGRTALWELGWLRIQENLPWGAGLGSFHALEGGARVKGNVAQWLGVHNTYLMILGEGGLFPFILFIALMVRLLVVGMRLRENIVVVGFIAVFLIDLTSIHNGFLLRLPNVALAVVLALTTRAQSRVPWDGGVSLAGPALKKAV